MFQIKQPDSFALRIAEEVDRIANDVLQAFATGVMGAFKVLWYREDGTVRPAEEVQRILDAFENPAELFQRYAQNVEFMNQQAPGLFTQEQTAVPLPYDIDPDTGRITVRENP